MRKSDQNRHCSWVSSFLKLLKPELGLMSKDNDKFVVNFDRKARLLSFFGFSLDKSFCTFGHIYSCCSALSSIPTQLWWYQHWQTSQLIQFCFISSSHFPHMQLDRAELCFCWHGSQVKAKLGWTPTQVEWNVWSWMLDFGRTIWRKLPLI